MIWFIINIFEEKVNNAREFIILNRILQHDILKGPKYYRIC